MKNRNTSVLYNNTTVDFLVPSTPEEFESLVGESPLESGIDDIIYRNTYPRFYAAWAEEVEKAGLGVRNPKAATKEKKDKEGKVTTVDVPESDMVFLDRLWTTANDDGKKALAEMAQNLAKGFAFYEKGDRSGGGKIAAGAIEAAQKFINAGSEAKVADHIEATIPGYRISRNSDGTISVDALARGIAALGKHAEQKAKQEQMNALGQLAA